jgi:hypothetical protein
MRRGKNSEELCFMNESAINFISGTEEIEANINQLNQNS